MTSQLIMDRSDGGVDAMVKDWSVGGTYELRVKVRQTGASESTATFDVIEATDESVEAEPEEAPEEAPPPKPKASKPSIVIAKY
jgi:hypothetical protein